MKHRNVTKRLLAVLLSTFMIVTMLPLTGYGEKVSAETGKSSDGLELPLIGFGEISSNGIQLPDDDEWEKTIYGISTTGIASPSYAGHTRHNWLGSYVWYGKYNGEPVKYRVLDPNTTKYGGNTMFLDCDRILYKTRFFPTSDTSVANQWEHSELRSGLNGIEFLTAPDGFMYTEREAIINSYAPAHDLEEGHWTADAYGQFVEINGDKVFLLDAEEAEEIKYCYRYYTNKNYEMNQRRKKYGDEYASYWLRSAYLNQDGGSPLVGCIMADGYMYRNGVLGELGVSPAFNVDRSSILFSSLITGVGGKANAEYKLTLIDSSIELSSFALGSTPTVSGRMSAAGALAVRAYYKLTTDLIPNSISVFILDKEYTPGNTNEASVLFYHQDPLPEDTAPTYASTTFSLPSNLDVNEWGKSYYVYMVAEALNDIHETDYASEPAKLKAPKITYVTPQITKQPENATVEVGNVAQFSVEAVGNGTLSYQWQSRKNASAEWVNSGQSGAKTATLSVTSNAGLNGYQFQCIVTQENGKTKTSDPVTMTVIPRIKTQPKDTYAKAGTTAKFSIAAEGKATLTYQWQSRKNASAEWVNSGQSGAKTATLSVATNAGLNGYQFRCIVKDGNKQTNESKPATLWISPLITKQPSNVIINEGATATFSITASGEGPFTYQWQSRKDSSSNWTSSSREGAKTNTFPISASAGLDGWQFRCVVTDKSGRMTVTSAATLTVKTKKAKILTQPKNTTAEVGDKAVFSVETMYSSECTVTYQWQSRKNSSSAWTNSGQEGAKTDTLRVSTNAGLHGWQFRCVVKTEGGRTESNAATLTMIPKITSQPDYVYGDYGDTISIPITVVGKGPLTYQWQSRKDDSSPWVNSGQSGARTATLTVKTNKGLNGYEFQCIVTDANGQKNVTKVIRMLLKDPSHEWL